MSIKYKHTSRKQKDYDPFAKKQGKCLSCNLKTIIVVGTGMCGPCTFGEADTAGGKW